MFRRSDDEKEEGEEKEEMEKEEEEKEEEIGKTHFHLSDTPHSLFWLIC